jgi:hypothetical protein
LKGRKKIAVKGRNEDERVSRKKRTKQEGGAE